MNVRKFLVYFIMPVVLTGVLILMYFSGVEVLQQIIAPTFRGINPDTAREMGLLETIEHLLIFGIITVPLIGFFRKPTRLEKAACAGIALFSVFVLLEEIDYGLHYYEFARGVTWAESAQVRNWHNQGNRTDVIKRAVDVGMVLFFLVAPLVLANSHNRWLRYLTPDRYSILTLVAMVLLRTLAHELANRSTVPRGSINQNLSEFRELVIFYLSLVYLIEVVFRRSLPAKDVAPISIPSSGMHQGGQG